MAKEIPWDEDTDAFISDLDDVLSKKYKISIRSLLLNPEKYMEKEGFSDTMKGIRADTDGYFSQLLDGLKDEQAKLETDMEQATEQYKQVDSIISNKSAAARVPYIKPMFVTRNLDAEETIVIEKYEDSFDAFIGKLISASNYVADMSTKYKNYVLGSWLFSGMKNYALSINPPESPVLTIENGKDSINDMLDSIQSR